MYVCSLAIRFIKFILREYSVVLLFKYSISPWFFVTYLNKEVLSSSEKKFPKFQLLKLTFLNKSCDYHNIRFIVTTFYKQSSFLRYNCNGTSKSYCYSVQDLNLSDNITSTKMVYKLLGVSHLISLH